MLDLVVIGHLLKEKIIFPDGKEIGPVLGSPAAYASVAAARLGIKTGIVTKIGNDMPRELMNVFNKAVVDTNGVKIGKDSTTNLLIYEKSGRKRLEFLKKAPEISFEDIPSGYLDAELFLICPIDYEVDRATIEKLREPKRRLAMELGGYGGASSHPGKFPKKERIAFLKEIAKYFEVIKGGHEDCRCLFEEDFPDEEKIAADLVRWGAEIGIVTLGDKGAFLTTEKSSLRLPAFPTRVEDCTGAGDVWHAAFLACYLRNKDTRKSGLFASATSSLVIEKTGGVTASRMPTAAQVHERMNSNNKLDTRLIVR